ncbi:MAG: hypothetical protein D6806_03330 [Deltaproteobacteria bacterium]|nr:MAG: hypothetical protein D6806_03330 [Deltaproteobacteria bacterium]
MASGPDRGQEVVPGSRDGLQPGSDSASAVRAEQATEPDSRRRAFLFYLCVRLSSHDVVIRPNGPPDAPCNTPLAGFYLLPSNPTSSDIRWPIIRKTRLCNGLLDGEYLIFLTTNADLTLSTCFHEVLGNPDVELRYLKLLLEHGADANIERGASGWTPILVNMEHEKTELLIKAGADVNHITVSGNSALLLADCSSWGAMKRSLALLKAGADFRFVGPKGEDFVWQNVGYLLGHQKLAYAHKENEALRKAICQFLLDRGCDLEAAWRAKTVDRSILQELFPEAGPLDDYEKRVKLWHSMDKRTLARVRARIEAEEKKLGNLRTPAHLRPWLRPKGSPHERVRWKAEEFFSDPKVIALCKAIEAKDLGKIDELIAQGADVNARGRGNMTPLLWAFPGGEEVFRRILEHGADPNVKLTEKIYPFYAWDSVTFLAAGPSPSHACIFHDIPMDNYLELVLEHGGDPQIENGYGRTPLFSAVTAFENSEKRIRLLLEAGADINHQDRFGDTPAMFAERHRRYDSLLVLLEAGADLRLVNKSGLDVVFMVARRLEFPTARAQHDKPVIDWFKGKGYDVEAAQQIVGTYPPLRDLPVEQRPWLNPVKRESRNVTE